MKQKFESVWDSIEDDPASAANLRLRSQLMMEVSDYVKKSGLTQAAAAKKLGTTQPRLNDVLQGKIKKCTAWSTCWRSLVILLTLKFRTQLECLFRC